MNSTPVAQDPAIGLRQAIAMETPKAIELWLEVVAPSARIRQLAKLSKADRRQLGALLDPQTAAQLFGGIDGSLGAELVRVQPVSHGAELLAAVDADRASDILRHIDRDQREPLLTAMALDQAKLLRGLLSWPEDSVAAHMTPDTLTLAPEMTAAEAVEVIRERAAKRRNENAGSYVYVTGAEQELLGVISFRSLVLTQPDRLVADLLEEHTVTVAPLTDVERAARTIIGRRLDELPVVDADNRLLGVLTEEHAVEILEEEITEDAEKQGGSSPLDVPYLSASPWLLWRKRIVWLLVLFAAEAYTGTVLRAFQDEMEAVVALAFFIPLLIGTGGNTGTQITTTLVRAMGTGQVRLRDLPAVVSKELSTGMLIAIAMAVAALIRAWSLGVGPQVTLTVCLTVAAIVLWSALVSSVLPLLLKQVRIDPAVVSAPLIATVVDGTGLMIYFMIAHLTLPQLAGL